MQSFRRVENGMYPMGTLLPGRNLSESNWDAAGPRTGLVGMKRMVLCQDREIGDIKFKAVFRTNNVSKGDFVVRRPLQVEGEGVLS
jgi:hypothetical protein